MATRNELHEIDEELQRLKERREEREKEIELLESALAPIRRLPFDVLYRIFLTYKDMFLEMEASEERVLYETRVRPRKYTENNRLLGGDTFFIHPQFVFTQICHEWRVAAFNTARLWDWITWSPKWEDITKHRPVVEAFMKRGKGMPLDVVIVPPDRYRFEVYKELDDAMEGAKTILDLISPVCSRWRTLELYLPINTLAMMENLQGPPLHRLRRVNLHVIGSHNRFFEYVKNPVRTFTDAPLLTEVRIDAEFGIPFPTFNLLKLPWTQLTRLDFPTALAPDGEGLRDILMRCKNLVEAILFVPQRIDRLRKFYPGDVRTLPHLKSLHLLFDRYCGIKCILDSVNLPALKHLTLEQPNAAGKTRIVGQGLVRMWTRAPFSLESLKMANVEGMQMEELEFFLDRMNDISELALVDVDVNDEFRVILPERIAQKLRFNGAATAHILPKLVKLTLHLTFSEEERADLLIKSVLTRWNSKDDIMDPNPDWQGWVMVPLDSEKFMPVCSLKSVDFWTIGGQTRAGVLQKLFECEEQGLEVKYRRTDFDDHGGYASEEV